MIISEHQSNSHLGSPPAGESTRSEWVDGVWVERVPDPSGTVVIADGSTTQVIDVPCPGIEWMSNVAPIELARSRIPNIP
jgi:hypothetical protein